MRVYRYEPEIYYLTFAPHPPVLVAELPCVIETTTVDASGKNESWQEVPDGRFHSEPDTEMRRSNPLTGPFFFEGLARGEVLAVTIEEIELTRDGAYSCFVPGFGAMAPEAVVFGESGLTEDLPPLEFRWKFNEDRTRATLQLTQSSRGVVEIPLEPFLGSIGLAPRWGMRISSLSAGEHGGNMDCVETRAGTTLYLPVFVDGGYLFLGDCHAVQGDGEACGVALETTSRVRLRAEKASMKPVEIPRLEDSDYIMTAGIARPLIDAYRISFAGMVRWLAKDYHFDKWEAFQVLSQVARVRVGNVVDPNYCVVTKCPKSIL